MQFQTYLRVPDRSPTASPNAFIFEFGYEGTSLATRHAASMVPVSLVRSLSNAQLEYITNVETKVNTVIFQVQTVSQVPMGGGMVIQGPLGFEFPDACQPEAAPMARGSTYQVQPMVSKVMRPVTAKSDSFFFFFFSLSFSLSLSLSLYLSLSISQSISLSLYLSVYIYIYIYLSLSLALLSLSFSLALYIYIYISFHIRSLFLAEICQSQPRQSPG
ncbi:unnamed protein product [Effrenium voratum]|nr:unnamed protein product [Effrenium voratum]